MFPRARAAAPLLLALFATLLSAGRARHLLRPDAARDTVRTAREARLDTLARGVAAGDTIHFVYCGPAEGFTERYYRAQYALAPARLDTSHTRAPGRRVLLDQGEPCPPAVARELGVARTSGAPILLAPAALP